MCVAVRRISLAAVTFAALSAFSGSAMAACESSTSPQRAARARASEDAVNNILNDAAAALARGDFGDACVKYRLVLSVDENNLAARLGLGEGALGEGNVNAASSHFTAAATAAPDNAAAQQGLGLAKLLGGDFAAAEQHLRRSVDMDPTLWRSWNGLGVIADGRSDWAAADVAWDAAIAAAPNEAKLHNNRGMSLMRRGEPARAVEAFDTALRLDHAFTTAANNRRIALAQSGQYDAALAGVSERDLPAALNNVAVAAARRGDQAVASRLLAAAVTASPRYYELAVRNRESLGPPAP